MRTLFHLSYGNSSRVWWEKTKLTDARCEPFPGLKHLLQYHHLFFTWPVGIMQEFHRSIRRCLASTQGNTVQCGSTLSQARPLLINILVLRQLKQSDRNFRMMPLRAMMLLVQMVSMCDVTVRNGLYYLNQGVAIIEHISFRAGRGPIPLP